MRARPVISEWTAAMLHHAKPVMVGLLLTAAAVFAVLGLRPAESGQLVVVTAEDIAPGHVIESRELLLVRVPAAAAPVDAAANLEDVSQKRSGRALPKGHLVTLRDLDANDSGVPPGRSRLYVELAPERVSVQSGPIDIWGPADACADPDAALQLLASGAMIEEVIEPQSSAFQSEVAARVTLLVPSSDVAAVLCAAGADTLHFVVTSGG